MNKNINNICALLLAYTIADKYEATISQIVINDDGFSCDFKAKENLSINELGKITKNIKKCIDSNFKITKSKIDLNLNKYEASFLKNNPDACLYTINDKVKLIANDFEIIKPSSVKAYELTNIGGIYFENNAKNELLNRIYGFAFESKEALEEHKKILTIQRETDHRKIGSDLELFAFDQIVGQGLPIWLPNGTIIKNEIEAFMRDVLFEHDFQLVASPVLGSSELYKVSGHWYHYRENMFSPIKIDEEEYVLRPMTCPHHLAIYKLKPHSYKELPIRYSEQAILHRYESSGSLTGLERVRNMQLIDSHSICTTDQIETEIFKAYEVIQHCHKILGSKIHEVHLSLHDPENKEKFINNPELWKTAEELTEKALIRLGIKYKKMIGEAAFYGPKIDLQVKTVLGRIITISTIQLDFLLPERFNLKYINEKGENATPVLIHIGIIGTLERFVSMLLEQTKGVLPFWLAPIQVCIIPVNENCVKFCNDLKTKLKQLKIRVNVDITQERLGKKIRSAQIKKIPYQIVIGEKELQNKNISYREYGKEEVIELSFEKFADLLTTRIKEKK